MKKQFLIIYNKKFFIFVILFFIFISIRSFAQQPAPPNIPRITAQAIKEIIRTGKKYIFIDSCTFGKSHVCGAIFISHLWVPPYGPNRIKRIRIPKDYYIFCYCT